VSVPLPLELPGEFFVLQYDRLYERFVLIVDDEDRSSYNLHGDIPAIMGYFKRWGLEEVGNRAIDTAREFGAAQAIPSDGRVIALCNRDPQKPAIKFDDEESDDVFRSGFRRY
jgi:hypothetical protein